MSPLTTNIGRNVSKDDIKLQRQTGGVGVAVVITLTAVEGRRHQLHKVVWSYNGVPTGGRLYIEDGAGGTILFDIDITNSGPGGFEFSNIIGSVNTAMVITLAAATGVVGKLNLEYQTRM